MPDVTLAIFNKNESKSLKTLQLFFRERMKEEEKTIILPGQGFIVKMKQNDFSGIQVVVSFFIMKIQMLMTLFLKKYSTTMIKLKSIYQKLKIY